MSVTQKPGVTQEKHRVHPDGEGEKDPRVAFFDRHAPAWDNDTAEVTQTLARLEELRGRLGIVSGQSVLEVGCGTGRISGWLAGITHPGRVVAVDFSPGMLEQAKKRGLPVEFKLMDICGQARPMGLFDTILCFNAFPHFRDQAKALRNMRTLLKSSGQLIILHFASSTELNDFHSRHSHPICHDHIPDGGQWLKLLSAAGLRIESSADQPGLFLLKIRLFPCNKIGETNSVLTKALREIA